MPRDLVYYDPNENKSDSCAGAPKAKVKWKHPENLDKFTLSHYVYIYDGTKPVKRFVNESFTVDRNPSRAYGFEVYAVDKRANMR